ncbi:hypothetical protein BDW74DRAFT_158376 [Aspergillus multicolor]|uniref:uncharacterized protein n=1 Tax=Aspergillus multicolor TaxID=41759 RepID=UPI003CCDC7F8
MSAEPPSHFFGPQRARMSSTPRTGGTPSELMPPPKKMGRERTRFRTIRPVKSTSPSRIRV